MVVGGEEKWARSEGLDVTSLALPKHTPCKAAAADKCEGSRAAQEQHSCVCVVRLVHNV